MNGILFATLLAVQSLGAQNGTISGRILFSNGTPGAGIRVSAWTLPETADPSFSIAVSTQTDAQGRYRLEAVPAGRYYIGAGRIDAITYFPGVSIASRATAVTVNQGAAMTGFDFAIEPLLIVSGVLVKGNGSPFDPELLRILASRSGSRVWLVRDEGKDTTYTSIAPDGAFEIKNVRPGSYFMYFQSTTQAPDFHIVVTDKDILGLKLRATN